MAARSAWSSSGEVDFEKMELVIVECPENWPGCYAGGALRWEVHWVIYLKDFRQDRKMSRLFCERMSGAELIMIGFGLAGEGVLYYVQVGSAEH